MKKINFLKKTLFVFILLIMFDMFHIAYGVKDYTNGRAYLKYYKDKTYKGVYIVNNEGKESAIFFYGNNKMIAYRLPSNDSSDGRNFNYCYDNALFKAICYTPFSDIYIEINPILWDRIQAWLVSKLSNFEEQKFSTYDENINEYWREGDRIR